MPISIEQADSHVANWSAFLGSRGYWANHLFFTADAQTAADVLRSGQLVCRQNLGVIARDVANQGALAANVDAHNYVRLYFRPKTNFHLRTEGIKLLADQYRLEHHMSMPIIFVFDLKSIVTMRGVCFSNRNMAHAGQVPGNDWTYFSSIDFSKVYHEGPISDRIAGHEIRDIRMAEVLVPGSLALRGHLKYILCRTHFDRMSLQFLARGADSDLIELLRAAAKPAEMFFCWGSYIEELSVDDDVMTLRVKAARDYQSNQTIKFCVDLMNGNRVKQSWSEERVLKPIRLKGFDITQGDHWRIQIEESLAFIGLLDGKDKNIFLPQQ